MLTAHSPSRPKPMLQPFSNLKKSVEKYNSYIRKFPARVFLSITGYEKVNYEKLNFEGFEDAPTNIFGED